MGLHPPWSEAAKGYLVAVLVTVIAVLVRLALFGGIGDQTPFFPFVLAVLAAAWYGGLKPGLLTTFLGVVLGNCLLPQPFEFPRFGTYGAAIVSSLFLIVSVAATSMFGGLHAARRRTETKQQALAHAEEQVRSVVNHVAEGIITLNEQGMIQWLNPAGEKLFGYTAAEMGGKHVNLLMREPTSDEPDQFLAHFSCPGPPGILGTGKEVTGCRKDGSTFPMELAVSEFWANGRHYFSGIVRDITDRKRAEGILRTSEAQMRLLWESAETLLNADNPDAMLGRLFARISPQLEVDAYLNYLVDEKGEVLRLASCQGIPEETARRINRLDFGQAICGTVAMLRQPMVAINIQQSDDPRAQLVRSLGIRAYACNPLLAGDRLIGTLSFASRSRDCFEPSELEFLETISKYVTIAHERVRLIQRLREADRRKDEFLATLAHELRNPLAPMGNALQLWRMAGDNPTKREQARGMMERQFDQLVHLVDDLLDISRVTSGKLQIRKERVELASVMHSAIETASPLIEALGHELTVTIPPEPIHLDADPLRLAQVFSNLLNNAAKYTERGGRIWFTAQRQNHTAVVSVRDTGIGIAAESLPKIFNMFSQVEPALDRSQGGLGIGLSLVRGLVELHGGSIEAHSEGPKRGSEFIVRIAVSQIPVQGCTFSETNGKGAPQTHPYRILVVDDNRDAADSLEMVLECMGHQVQTAYDGVEGLEAAQTFLPDMVLLDIGLPRMNGYEAARRIRQEPWGQKMALIAVTGWGKDEDKQRALEAGCDHHLTKPVDPHLLEKLLERLSPGMHPTQS